MAADWLRQYSSSDIARTPSFKRDAFATSRQLSFHRRDSRDGIYNGSPTAHRGSYDPSERSYPESEDPGDDFGVDGLLIANGKPSGSLGVPSNLEGASNCAMSGGDRSESVEGNLDLFMRRRRSSITFDPKVRLNNGVETELKDPVPKLSIRTRPRGKSLLEEMAKFKGKNRARSENDSQEYDPITGERIDEKEEREKQQRRSAKYRANQPRWPLLQSTVDELASEIQQGTSLPKESQSLPSKVEETRTIGNIDAIVSPMNLASADAEWTAAAPKDIPQPLSSRSKSYAIERNNSYTSRFSRTYRRATTHSNSASPASLFLSRYTPSSPVSQPDDEGQEIGDYVLGREIGFGGFSTIREAFTISGNERIARAVKIVRKNVVGRGEQENDTLQAEFEREVEIWRSLSHPHILPLFAVYSTDFATFAITHLNTGGTLFDVVRSNRTGIDPKLTKRYAFQVAAALRYLHEDMHIVHRDIKLENCLVDRSAEDAAQTGGKILVCDFGLADYVNSEIASPARKAYQGTHPSGTGIDPRTPTTASYNIGPADTSTNFAGSLPYAAPELLEGGQGLLSTSVDMWAYGVVLYAMTMGKLPFSHAFAPRLRLMILGEEWDKEGLRDKEEKAGEKSPESPQADGLEEMHYNPNPLGGLSELIERCMELDPLTRWEISDVLCSQWLQEEVERADIEE